jgi:GNAT superfamily N-acetyltransferase
MPADNLERMIHLAEEFFAVKTDPEQLAMTPEIMERLRRIHSRTLNEAADDNGPIAWVTVIPTTRDVMDKFLSSSISEQALLDETPVGISYDAVYLCSALVLPEHRGKGLAKRLTIEAVQAIRSEHPISALFYWRFSNEGERLASVVAQACQLPLYQRKIV